MHCDFRFINIPALFWERLNRTCCTSSYVRDPLYILDHAYIVVDAIGLIEAFLLQGLIRHSFNLLKVFHNSIVTIMMSEDKNKVPRVANM